MFDIGPGKSAVVVVSDSAPPSDESSFPSEAAEPGVIVAPGVSQLRTGAFICHLSIISFVSCAANGLVVIGLPQITDELDLPPSLAFWPSSVGGLATAATLLLAGSVADVLGLRPMNLAGCFISGLLMIACGFVQSGEELVALRAAQGVGLAMHYSTSVALVTRFVSRGRGRNVAFACLGLSQPLGFSFGLVIGGVLVETIGWRVGWYVYGGSTLLLSVLGTWAIPSSDSSRHLGVLLQDMRSKVDWVGALLGSTFLALLSYYLLLVSPAPSLPSSGIERMLRKDIVLSVPTPGAPAGSAPPCRYVSAS